MPDQDTFRGRLNDLLARITPSHVVGVSGLAVLSAASLLALAASTEPTPGLAFAVWLGNLGLNVLASVVQQGYERELAKPSTDEMARLTDLAELITHWIRRRPELRVELGSFLETYDAIEISKEILLGNPATHGYLLVHILEEVTYFRADLDRIYERLAGLEDRTKEGSAIVPLPGSAPSPPSLFIGRQDAMDELKERLGLGKEHESAPVQVLTAVKGWPGVGKTTVAAALAHDPDIVTTFPDGVLWVSLGPRPQILSQLATWGRALGVDDLLLAKTVEEAKSRLTAILRNKRMLLIVDDAWEAEHALPFRVGGPGCAVLVTTRATEVAGALAATPQGVYPLDVLSDESALELLRAVASSVVEAYPDESLELVQELEGLPLAIRVAGSMLHAEAGYGFGVTDLLVDLREGARILSEAAPADRADLTTQTTPTVAALLKTSTDYLDEHTRECFALLGPFAPKPATFDLAAMVSMWQVDDPKPIARKLVDRGLLEPASLGRFQMHALLVAHAKSLLTEE